MNPTLWGRIADIYKGMDHEDCVWIDREWARLRGYIIPADGTSTLASALAQEPTAYRLDHPKYGTELSICQPSDDWGNRGWVVTPLYASPVPSAHRGGET